MELRVNGRPMEFEAQRLTGEALLARIDRSAAAMVAEVNGVIVPLAEFLRLELRDGDELELVTLVGGG